MAAGDRLAAFERPVCGEQDAHVVVGVVAPPHAHTCGVAPDVDQQALAQQLLAQARERGIDLVGPDGLLNRLTKNVLATALEAETDEHLLLLPDAVFSPAQRFL
ncbi:hypothetical protein QFZ33_000800 [Arthrobacter globiformis]|uniref:hypothetical protein n=1 Tax=Arthrobacter globiformis TaxID=1665 RepID=UPI0027937AD6|nr:hypothetical protein [Arthrobacter globiformis]